MKRVALKVSPRKVLGKKVKKLRKEGLMPANIYGKDVKSQAVELPQKEFLNVFKEVGETGLVDLEVGGKVTPVLIHNVQTNYNNDTLHADFYVVNLKEKVKTNVPLELTGEPKAVTDKLGLLMQIMSEVEVEALPTDLPEKIEIDVTPLSVVDEQFTIEDVKAPQGVEILTPKTQVIAKIGELISKEAQEQMAAEAAAAEAAKAATAEAGAEGEVPAAEGETPSEGEKPAEEPKAEEPTPVKQASSPDK